MNSITYKLDEDVINILKASNIDGNKLFLPANLDRSLYVKTNKALELIGGKWNRSAKAHVFSVEGDAIKRLWGQAIESGAVVDKKKTFQFYETSKEVADFLIELAVLKAEATVLEPSAGLGAIADRIKAFGATPVLYEIDEEKCEALEAKSYHPHCVDFLTTSAEFKYIIANPPFAKRQDVKHILHMWGILQPGGTLVSIASAGVKSNSDKLTKQLRSLVEEYGEFFDLPEGSFAESGTMVRTTIVRLWKP